MKRGTSASASTEPRGSASPGGQTLMSNATAGIVEDLGLEGVRFHEVGEHLLKDMERPQRLFQLDVDGLLGLPAPSGARAVSRARDLLATDLLGWTTLLHVVGDEAAVEAASRYKRSSAPRRERHGGRAVEAVADHALAFFERPRMR